MARQANDEERLRGTGFDSIAELEKAEQAIQRDVWQDLARAKASHELLAKPEFAVLRASRRVGLEVLVSNGTYPDTAALRIVRSPEHGALIQVVAPDIRSAVALLRGCLAGWHPYL